MNTTERETETLRIDDLVSLNRVGPFVTLRLPSTNVNILHIQNSTWVLPLLTFPGKPEGFVNSDLKRIFLDEEKKEQGPYILISPNVETANLEKPFKMSPDSEAKYLAMLETDGLRFLLQYLDGQTSRHSHDGLELFYPLVDGEPSYGKNSSVFSVIEPVWLEPWTDHEAFSLNHPTLTLIVQPVDVRHIPDPNGRSDLEKMREEARHLG